eukprot:COSAG01_NODE_4165_length_5277_cov_3.029741_3_plen_111_part_00
MESDAILTFSCLCVHRQAMHEDSIVGSVMSSVVRVIEMRVRTLVWLLTQQSKRQLRKLRRSWSRRGPNCRQQWLKPDSKRCDKGWLETRKGKNKRRKCRIVMIVSLVDAK